MDPVFLARLQFAATTIYHFFFVPLTLGLSIIVALMETIYVRTGREVFKRMTKFWGKLLIINFALGVVTRRALGHLLARHYPLRASDREAAFRCQAADRVHPAARQRDPDPAVEAAA